jgi:hypothetical protein
VLSSPGSVIPRRLAVVHKDEVYYVGVDDDGGEPLGAALRVARIAQSV